MPMSVIIQVMKIWVWGVIYQEKVVEWIEEENLKQLIEDAQLTPLLLFTSSMLVVVGLFSLS